MFQIKYNPKFNTYFMSMFYFLIITIIVLSIAPHENVAQQMSQTSSSSFWSFANEYNEISKLAYIGEDLFGILSDKMRHILAFLALSLCIDFAYILLSKQKKIYILIFYGVFIEILQYFLPYRNFDFVDIVFNSLAVLVYFLIVRRFFMVKVV